MNLDSFFRPRSIAVVGASQNPDKLGSIIFQNIIDSGFMKPKAEGTSTSLSDSETFGGPGGDNVSERQKDGANKKVDARVLSPSERFGDFSAMKSHAGAQGQASPRGQDGEGTINSFQNISEKKKKRLYAVNPKLSGKKLAGCEAYASITEIKEVLDLVVVVVPGRFVSAVIDDCVKNRTKNVIVISAGFGEVGNHDREEEIKEKCAQAGIRLLGPNCLGAIFPHAHVNASFADGQPLPGGIGFISQSGAFCTAMLDWATDRGIGFSHFISLGNKADLSEMDLVEAMAEDPNVESIALYLETIEYGAPWMNLIRRVARQKPIVILEPGESKAAQAASLSHTGSLAPNARIIREAYRHAGAIQVDSMRDMFGVLEMLTWAAGRHTGKNLAIITNAGGVGVLTSDLVEKYNLDLAPISPAAKARLQEVLPDTAGLGNPIDVIGDADAQRYQDALDALVHAADIDQILVLLTPQKTTEVKKTAELIRDIRKKTNKNIVASFVGGARVKAGIQILRDADVPVYEFPDDAVRVMSLITNRLDAIEETYEYKPKAEGTSTSLSDSQTVNMARSHSAEEPFPPGGGESSAKIFPEGENILHKSRRQNQSGQKTVKNDQNEKKKNRADLHKLLKDAKAKGLASLPQPDVRDLMKSVGIEMPVSCETMNKEFAQAWASDFWQSNEGEALVMKISAPDAIHKTELKGVVLGIEDMEQFDNAWEILRRSIAKGNIQNAVIQAQHQIRGGQHLILGVNSDPTFGKVMLIGSGGIYSEIWADTAVRVLPTNRFDQMLEETNIGEIISGARGEDPLAISALRETMERIQDLALLYPEIVSIDINPLILTKKGSYCVDVKVILK